MNTFLPRHPVDHPEFQYRPSANPYWKRLHELASGVYLDARAETLAGHWRAQFKEGSQRDLIVEIGCNGGHWILERARTHPDQCFIGIDWKFKQIHRAYEKALQRELKNVFFVRGYAQRLGYLFGKEEVSATHLFFPDPWPKKSQQKNRFLTSSWFDLLAQRTQAGGTLELKSDHGEYFDWITQQVQDSESWTLETLTHDLHGNSPLASRLPLGEVTLFEQLFIKKGLPIHHARWKRLTPLLHS